MYLFNTHFSLGLQI